jgi:DNA-binding MurR/RpiR family transcriptional regulator
MTAARSDSTSRTNPTGGNGVSIQTNIQAKLDDLAPSMRRVGQAILQHPPVVVERSITELAKLCNTSETSIVRFCRKLGFTGYAQFKLTMAAELATESAQSFGDVGHGADIGIDDSLGDAVAKIARAESLGIQETTANLDLAALERIVSAIDSSSRVIIYGVGASNAGAQDLVQKLLRIGRVAIGFHDAHEAVVSASLLQPGDVAIAISHSGRTREPIELLRAARHAGAVTVAITNVDDSPITEFADDVLRTAVRETTFRSGAMASRIAQLALIDYVFVGVARKNFEQTVAALEVTYDSVRALRDDRGR